MQGRRSQGNPLVQPLEDLHKPRGDNLEQEQQQDHRIEEVEEPVKMVNQNVIVEEVVPHQRMMRDYAWPVIGSTTIRIVLGEATRNYDFKNIHYNMFPSFHGLPIKDPLSFMRDFYSRIELRHVLCCCHQDH